MSLADAPFQSLSDPADQWRGENADAASAASSRHSVNSLARRESARNLFEAQQKERMAKFLAEEEAMREELEGKMKLEDEASEMERPVGGVPGGSALAAEPGVIRRRLEDLEHEVASLRRVLGVKEDPSTPRPLPPQPAATLPVLARFGVKVKVDKPKPWTGVFEEQAREMWIRSASLYLVGNELELGAVLDEHLTPAPFYVVRSLFSPDATHGLLSPQAWFDARNRRSPFTSVTDVFAAMRSHWADDHAAEDALARYRAATQGSLRARDFGAKVDALADACTDRLVDDLDRKTTFVGGLNVAVKDFVKTQLVSRAALGKVTATFEDVVKIAALTDGLAGFSSKKTSSSSSPLPSSTKKTAYESSPSPSFPSRPAVPFSHWIDQAVDWQQKNPTADKAKWFEAHAQPPTKSIRCFNCGEMAGHYSRACPKTRKNPKVVVLTALAKISRSPAPPPPAREPTLDVESANRFTELADGGSSDSGKADKE
ncbi:hypothetical protein JCM11641_004437 [Rhodosporidiobolus odoratus]